MKNRIIVTVALVLIAGCACAQKVIPELKGEYRVDGFGIKTDIQTAGSKGLLNFGKVPFNFLDNDTVLISQELGKNMFGGIVFKYELTDTHCILTFKEKRIEIPYSTNNDGFNLKINDENFRHIVLVPLNAPTWREREEAIKSGIQQRKDSTGIIRAPSFL